MAFPVTSPLAPLNFSLPRSRSAQISIPYQPGLPLGTVAPGLPLTFLVIIAIIALLASLLLPALSRAKAEAYRAQCQEQIIGGLTLNGTEYQFSFFDLQMLAGSISDAERQSLPNDLNQTRRGLVMEMYLRRYPN